MQTQITFRHLKSETELREAAMEAAQKFEKYYDGITSTKIEFIADNYHTVEFTVRVNGSTLVVKESSDDFQKSLHQGSDKIVRQLKKQKTKANKAKNDSIRFMLY